MAVNPSSTRRYDARNRQAKAQESRKRMVGCARELFISRGYAATSLEDVARAAKVGRRTVYDAFGSKRGVLFAILGDLAPTQQETFRHALAAAAGDVHTQLRLMVEFVTSMYSEAVDVLDMVHAAAGADPDLAALDEEGESRRLRNERPTVVDWHERGFLKPDLTVDTAADILWAMTSPWVYRLFVVQRSWALERYRGWLIEELTHQLLRST